jgi:hypothetical protein
MEKTLKAAVLTAALLLTKLLLLGGILSPDITPKRCDGHWTA